MIYLEIEGHKYIKAVEDLVRAFFKCSKIKIYNNGAATENFRANPSGEEDIFIKSIVSSTFEIKAKVYNAAGKCLEKDSIYERPSGYSNPIFGGRKSWVKGKKELHFRNAIKRTLYDVLWEYSEKKLPWGILTGIRPASIAVEYIRKNIPREEIIKDLEEEYYITREKAELLCSVAEYEVKILRRTPEKSVSLYIGIPFCLSRCLYCSFISQEGTKSHAADEYLDALEKELKAVGGIFRNYERKVQSIYIGGGTPTALSHEQLQKLFRMIHANIDMKSMEEFTFEAGRADTVTYKKLSAAKKAGVTRLCINPQTMNDETLRRIGRRHSAEDVKIAFEIARKVGFENINSDLIIGLPGETAAMFQNTLDEMQKLKPDGITVHSLSVKRAAALRSDLFIDDSITEKMYDLSIQYAQMLGFVPYYLYRQKNMAGDLENIGFCLKGKESIYNIQIMEEKQTIVAAGAGGISKFYFPDENRLERVANVKIAEDYIARNAEMIKRKIDFIDEHDWK